MQGSYKPQKATAEYSMQQLSIDVDDMPCDRNTVLGTVVILFRLELYRTLFLYTIYILNIYGTIVL
jgi:hypothetical protein